MERFCLDGLFPILECFPTFKSALLFLKTLKKKNTICLEKHFVIDSLKDGNKISRLDGLLHSIDDNPAFIQYRKNGLIQRVCWYRNGLIHRKDNPASIKFYKNGHVHIVYWYRYDKLDRKDGPAVITYRENGQIRHEQWYRYDKLDRKDGPADIAYRENGRILYELWYTNNEINRKDGPAFIMRMDKLDQRLRNDTCL